MPDAVVIGAGPNGLVAANRLADAGWSVTVVEAAEVAGGAVRTAEVTAPGFRNDLFSAFYPLSVVSPVIAALGLEEYGLAWTHAPLVVAHPLSRDRAVLLSRDRDETAASVDSFRRGDGAAWIAMVEEFERIREPLLEALFRPFPPVRPGVALARRLGTAGLLRFARFATLPLRRWTDEEFGGIGAASLTAGNALHSDLGPDAAGSAVFGWLLCMLGQLVGFPVPVGGAGALSDAMLARAQARGVRVLCATPATGVIVRGGRAVGVRTATGEEITAGKAVLAAVDAPQLFGDLVGPEHLPRRVLRDLRRFQWDNATLKVDWALDAPIPWEAEGCARAGTLHLGGDVDALSRYAASLSQGLVPADPYLVVGQMTTTDPTRSPAGTEAAWAYTHLPQRVRGDAGDDAIAGLWDEREVEAVVRRVEEQVERQAPGFRSHIVARHVFGPREFQRSDRSLHRGALNGGSAAVHQQLFWRPIPGLGRPETPVRGLYLASASAHPGGSVHGACGSIAATTALRDAGWLGPARLAVTRGLQGRIYR